MNPGLEICSTNAVWGGAWSSGLSEATVPGHSGPATKCFFCSRLPIQEHILRVMRGRQEFHAASCSILIRAWRWQQLSWQSRGEACGTCRVSLPPGSLPPASILAQVPPGRVAVLRRTWPHALFITSLVSLTWDKSHVLLNFRFCVCELHQTNRNSTQKYINV